MVGGWRWRGASASSEVRRCICSVVGVAQQPSCSLCVFLPNCLSVCLSGARRRGCARCQLRSCSSAMAFRAQSTWLGSGLGLGLGLG